MAFRIQPIGADPGTIYIRADGSIDPPTAPITSADNITYTFADNIYGDTIAVERNNIVVDGNGYTLQGTGFGMGIYLPGRTNVTVRNTQIKNFVYGIDASFSSGNMISGNNITANSNDGVYIRDSAHITVSGNNITKNSRDGVRLEFSSNTNITVSGNNITANSDSGVFLRQVAPFPWGITVADNNIANSYYGVYVDRSKGSLGGISVAGNNIANNFYGAFLSNSTNIMVSGNNMTANYVQGVWGEYSFDNMISGNSITNSVDGIYLDFSDNNMISGNNIANNSNGVYLDSSSTNEFYHNNFMNNPTQVIVASSDSSWDDGYPSGGNYWSDYSGPDEFSGPYQNETGSDFIGDTKYKINDNNIDHYPLMILYETTPPTIIITSPENKTYAVNANIPLTFTVDEFTSWIGYSLDGQASVTITGNTTLPTLPDGWHHVSVYANDTFGNIGMSIVHFTVDTTSPVANAGPDQTVDEDTVVTFDGSVSADENGITAYTWVFTDLTPKTLSGKNPTYTFATPWTYTVTLEVADPAGNTATDTVTITVLDVTNPVAHAGSDRTVNEDVATTLDGSASVDNVGIAGYTWTFTDVTVKTLTADKPAYTFSNPGVYTITLNVTDAAGNWATDTVVITVLDITKPVANAGNDQTANVGATVTLDGGGSTDNVGITNYEWNFGDGTTGTGKTTTHEYTKAGTYTATLTVKDAAGNQGTDTMTVTVLSTEGFPIWIVAAVGVAAIGIAVAAIIFWKRRK